jgi:hypothetical protein
VRGTASNGYENLWMIFNGDSAAHYNYQASDFNNTYGIGEANAQTSLPGGIVADAASTTGFAGSARVDIFNYANTNWFKNELSDFHQFTSTAVGSTQRSNVAGQWTSTSAITSITITIAAGDYAAGSTFTLYGMQ